MKGQSRRFCANEGHSLLEKPMRKDTVMSHKTVAEVIVETLQSAGVEHCWGVPGDTLNYVTDAIRRSGIEWVHVRHEEVGGFAAGAERYSAGISRRVQVLAGQGAGRQNRLRWEIRLCSARRTRSPPCGDPEYRLMLPM
jgi:Thiamine pyrophosphate enzyme, N-terminal TPP binding domain